MDVENARKAKEVAEKDLADRKGSIELLKKGFKKKYEGKVAELNVMPGDKKVAKEALAKAERGSKEAG